LVLFALAVVYATSLGIASLASIRESWTRASPDAPRIVLSPLTPLDHHGESRTVETRVEGMRVRRLCADGRCELLAGEGDGFALLASYPDDRYVELQAGPRVSLRDVGELRAQARPVLADLASVAPGLWLVTGLLGFATMLILFARQAAIERDLELVARGRPAVVDEDGRLRFLDDAMPQAAHIVRALKPGPAVGLFPATWNPQTRSTYRAHEEPTWFAVEGDRDALIAAHGGARAATTTVLTGLALLTVGAVLAALIA
jgi:hypothetical protein